MYIIVKHGLYSVLPENDLRFYGLNNPLLPLISPSKGPGMNKAKGVLTPKKVWCLFFWGGYHDQSLRGN